MQQQHKPAVYVCCFAVVDLIDLFAAVLARAAKPQSINETNGKQTNNPRRQLMKLMQQTNNVSALSLFECIDFSLVAAKTKCGLFNKCNWLPFV